MQARVGLGMYTGRDGRPEARLVVYVEWNGTESAVASARTAGRLKNAVARISNLRGTDLNDEIDRVYAETAQYIKFTRRERR